MSLRVAGVLAITMSCWPVCGQLVISARSGLITDVEGQVLLGGEPLVSRAGARAEMQEGSELRTVDGRAEVLLNPGVFLRVGENSAVRMVSNRLADVRIEFISGAAIIAASGRLNAKENWASSVSIGYKEAIVRLLKNGIYRLDAEPVQLRVYAGQASVTQGAGTRVVAGGERITLANREAPQEFDVNTTDSLSLWNQHRTEYILITNRVASRLARLSVFGRACRCPSFRTSRWGRMASCGQLLIGLLAMGRKLQEADCQSAAGFQPALHHPRRYLLKKSRVRCQASLAAAWS